MMKKRFYLLCSVVAVLTVLLFCCCGVSAATTGPWDISQAGDDSVTAEVVKNGNSETYTLKVNSAVKNGVIRDFLTYDDPGWRDAYGSAITAVEIGPDIAEIGENAFYQLNHVTAVTVASAVTTVARGAFYGVGSEVDSGFTLTFRDDVGTLEPNAFFSAAAQASAIDIHFKGNLGTVAENAFCNLGRNLGTHASKSGSTMNFTVDGHVKTLASHCFFNAALDVAGVSAATKFTFAGNVENIADEAFKGVLSNAVDGAEQCLTLEIAVAGDVFRLGEDAFDRVGYGIGNRNGESQCVLTVGRCLCEKIPARCFKSFGSRTVITLTMPNLKTVGEEAFQYTGSDSFTLKLNGATNAVPQGVKYIGANAFGWVGAAVTVPEEFEVAVGEKAFDSYRHPLAAWTTFSADTAFTPTATAGGETGVTVTPYRFADGSSDQLARGEILGARIENDGSLYADKDLYLLVQPKTVGAVTYLTVPSVTCGEAWEDGGYTRDFRYFTAAAETTALTFGVYAKTLDGAGNVTMKKVAETEAELTAPNLVKSLKALRGGMFLDQTVTVPELLTAMGLPYCEGMTVTALAVDHEEVVAPTANFALNAMNPGTAEVTFSGRYAPAYGGGTFTGAVLRLQVVAAPRLQTAATSLKVSDNPTAPGWEYALNGGDFRSVTPEYTLSQLVPATDYSLLYRLKGASSASPTLLPLTFTTVAGYDIRVQNALHGYVEPSVHGAAPGETVTITPFAYPGYDLLKVTVKDNQGNDVPVVKDAFVMPASDVTLTPYFAVTDYTVTAAEAFNGTVTLSKTAALAGSEVKIFATPKEHYRIGTVLAETVSGVGLPVNDMTFMMPAESVKVTVTFVPDSGVSRLLETTIHGNYINGYEDGTLRPEGNLTRAETAQMFCSLLLDAEDTEFAVFADVTEEDWFYRSVGIMAGLGIIKGYEDGTFRGNQLITRAEFTAIASRFAYETAGESDFYDVPSDHWAKPCIDTAVVYGWINGYADGTFHPEANIIRAEAVTIINRMLERSADMSYIAANRDKLKSFSDLDETLWYYGNMMEAINAHDYVRDGNGEIWK